jgi:hypothetical protein
MKIAEKNVLPCDRWSWLMGVIHYLSKIFSRKMDFVGIKRRRIKRMFQKYKLTLLPKWTQNKDFRLFTGCPLCKGTVTRDFWPSVFFVSINSLLKLFWRAIYPAHTISSGLLTQPKRFQGGGGIYPTETTGINLTKFSKFRNFNGPAKTIQKFHAKFQLGHWPIQRAANFKKKRISSQSIS